MQTGPKKQFQMPTGTLNRGLHRDSWFKSSLRVGVTERDDVLITCP